ncbi:MAG: tetratricopeptide repeat protein [Prevotella sp.]|nr:tetratricopeptide repeat protein [Prevotella sp.]
MANKKEQGNAELNEVLSKSEAFAKQYGKAVVIALAAIILLIIGTFAYKYLVSGPRENKASTELGTGQELFGQELFETALNGDSANYSGFLKIAEDYSNTAAGNLANLYAGLCYANLDKWEEAVKYLDKYNTANDQLVSPAAVAALGNAYAHVERIDDAVNALKKAAKMADGKSANGVNNSFAPTFLLQAGKLLESQNKKEDALKVYQKIKEKYIGSILVQSGEIDKYIERASL